MLTNGRFILRNLYYHIALHQLSTVYSDRKAPCNFPEPYTVYMLFQMDERTLEDFDREWKIQADYGRCDSWGGMEYRRVRKEWFAAEKTRELEWFIRKRANIGPIPMEH